MSSKKLTCEQVKNSLQELLDEELKRFKNKLTYVGLKKKKFKNIPRGKIMEADTEDLS